MKKLLFLLSLIQIVNSYSQHSPQLWGLTLGGGVDDVGTIFHYTPKDSAHTLDFSFPSSSTQGNSPFGSLTLLDGKLYGMTSSGGINNMGVIFEWDPYGNVYTKKIDFDGTIGNGPSGSSLVLLNRKFYGMTKSGGAGFSGVIFEWDPSTNVFTKKIDFDGSAKGSRPEGSLTFFNGKFYGMTYAGGTNDLGVIFEWDPSNNNYTKKIDFDGSTKGRNPLGSLTLLNGKFYGMTYGDGSVANDGAIIFEWDPSNNNFIKKIDFDGSSGNTKGKAPHGSLTFSGSKFYGMTYWGGANNMGVIFEWDPISNVYSKKIDFDDITKGSHPSGDLILSGGKFYGLTSQDAATGYGVIFKWDPTTNNFVKLLDFNSSIGGRPYRTALLEVLSNQLPVLSGLPGTQNKTLGSANDSANFTLTDSDGDVPSFTSSSSNTTLLANGSITVSNIGGNSYQVAYYPAASQIGTTTVTIKVDDGFGGITSFNFDIQVDAFTSITNFNSETKINIYPNPSIGNFIIETNIVEKQTLKIFDITGKLLLTQIIQSGKTAIDVSSLSLGIYNLSISNNEMIENKRLMIVR